MIRWPQKSERNLGFNPEQFVSGGPAVADAPKAFDPASFVSSDPSPSSPKPVEEQMDWSAKFNGVDYAKNRMGPEDKSRFARLSKVTDNTADAQKQAISMAYVSKLLPDIPLATIQKNWPAVRNAYGAVGLGLTGGEVTEAKLYSAVNERVNANLQQHWATAKTSDRLKMMFGSHGYGDNMPVEGDPVIGAEVAGSKGTMFTIPKMEGNGSFAGLINATNRVMSGMTTPDNVALMVGTGGLGDLATFANGTRVAVVAKAAQAATVGTFVASGAKDTKEAYARTKMVMADPHSTDAQKTDAIASLVLTAAVTAAAAKGTYDLSKGTLMDAKPQAKGAEPVEKSPQQVEAENAKKIEASDLLRDEAQKAPPEMKAVLTEAAHQTHPHAQNGPQIEETHSGYAVTDAIGGHVGVYKTIEEAYEAAGKAKDAEPATLTQKQPQTADQMVEENQSEARNTDSSGKQAENRATGADKTAGIAHRVSEGQGAAAPRGETINIQDELDAGRKTYTPEQAESAVEAFEADPKKGVTRETLVQARLHDEALTRAADEAAEKFGENSLEEQSARRAMEDWKARIKPIQTEWHRHGLLQQGETELDTGTFRGMARGVREATRSEANPEGTEPTPKQAETIKEHVAKVREATADEGKASKAVAKALHEAAGEQPEPPVEPTRKPRTLTRKAAEARARIKAFRERPAPLNKQSGAVINPEEVAALLRDHAIIGAEYIAKGVSEFGEWSKAMVKEFGDYVKPHLNDLFQKSKEAVKTSQAEDVVLDHKAGEAWTPEQAKALWKRGAEMIDQGLSYDDMRHQLAKEYNFPVKDITEGIASKKAVREVTDEMYRKMDERRKAQNAAKAWVMEQKYPGYQKAFRAIHQGVFSLYTALHGTAWVTTHAAINLFVPKVTGPMILELGRAFRMMGDKAYHERIMQDMVRDPLFIKAKRSGLANDPFQYTDAFQNPESVKIFKEIGLIGNRGFDGLKLLRQFRFNQEWGTTPPELRTDLMAKIYSEGINKATGHSDLKGLSKGVKSLFFAPALEASKWAMQFTDPAKDSATLLRSLYDQKGVAPEQVKGAQQRMKFAVQAAGTYLGLLTLNQAILSATGSDQEINFTDPRHGGDWLHFKGFGMKSTPLAGFLRPMTYLMGLTHAFWGDRSKYEQSQGSRAGDAAKETGEYLRSKLHPAFGLAADAITGSDFQGNTMPWNDDKIPKFQAREGVHQYSAGEYAATHLAPIPWAEAAKEVWTEQGIGEAQQKEWMNALRQAFMAATTATRLTEDNSNHKEETSPEWMKRLLPPRNIDHSNK